MVVFGENYIHELMIRRKAQCSLQWKAAGTEFSEKTEAEFRLFLTLTFQAAADFQPRLQTAKSGQVRDFGSFVKEVAS